MVSLLATERRARISFVVCGIVALLVIAVAVSEQWLATRNGYVPDPQGHLPAFCGLAVSFKANVPFTEIRGFVEQDMSAGHRFGSSSMLSRIWFSLLNDEYRKIGWEHSLELARQYEKSQKPIEVIAYPASDDLQQWKDFLESAPMVERVTQLCSDLIP